MLRSSFCSIPVQFQIILHLYKATKSVTTQNVQSLVGFLTQRYIKINVCIISSHSIITCMPGLRDCFTVDSIAYWLIELFCASLLLQ